MGDIFTEALRKGDAIDRLVGLVGPDETAEILQKGRPAQIGEIRKWANGKYQKTPNGWVPVTEPKSKELDLEISTEEQFFHNGKWNEERVRTVHEPIIEKYLSKAKTTPTPPPVITLMMGAPASGKGTVVRHLKEAGQFSPELQIVDADEIKTKGLKSDYDKYAKRNQETAASMVHEEGSYLSKEIAQKLEQKGADYVQDKVFADYDKLKQEIDRLGTKGFKIKVVMATLSKEEAHKRMVERGERTGRYVPEDFFNWAHDNIGDAFDKLVNNLPKNVISLQQFDTTESPKLIKEIKNERKE